MANQAAKIELNQNTLQLSGDWNVRNLGSIAKNPLNNLVLPTYPITLDGRDIDALDSAGGYLIEHIKTLLNQAGVEVKEQGFNQQHQSLLHLVQTTKNSDTLTQAKTPNIFARFGKGIIDKFSEINAWMSFVGEFVLITLNLLKKPKNIPFKSVIASIEFAGVRSMPIIAFLTFLIGVVLAYQIGVQLEVYGANIYIVNILGLAILREFGPLIAAIILAGRVGSAFTAHIGLMKANEELDALETMGLSTTVLLTFPRILGMIIAMPFLVVWSDIFGLFGGMFMAKVSLGVTFNNFLNQFPQVITLSSFVIGLVKAPVFAWIIASVGCFHGLKVSGSAQSIGIQTTKSVVLAIFLIIIADALFSVVLSVMGI